VKSSRPRRHYESSRAARSVDARYQSSLQHTSVESVFQIGIIIAISCSVLLATLVWSNRWRRSVVVPHEVRRVLIALERANRAALKGRLVKLPLPLGFAISGLVLESFLRHATRSTLFISIVAVALLITGASVSVLLAWYTASHLRNHASTVWNGTLESSSRALQSCWLASTSLLVSAEVAGIVTSVGSYGLLRLLFYSPPALTSLSSPTPDAGSLVAAGLTAIFGLGAATTAVWLQHMGNSCLGAATLRGETSFVHQTGLSECDPRNPAVLIDVLSRQLGEVLPRVLDAFVTSCLVSSISLLLFHHPTLTATMPHAAPFALLPLLLRGFGLLASLFGVLTVKAFEHENLDRAILRSYLVAELVFASATVGSNLWLIGSWSPAIVLGSVFGLVLPSLFAYSRTSRDCLNLFQRSRICNIGKEPDEQNYTSLSRTLKLTTFIPVSLYAIVFLFIAFYQRCTPDGGSILFVALILGLSIPSGLSSWHAAPSLALVFQGTANLSGSLGRIPVNEDFNRRSQRLTTALERLALLFDPLITDGGILLCGLTALVITSWTSPMPSLSPFPGLTAVALLAAFPVTFLLADSLRSGARSARTQTGEVERQLRGLRRVGDFAVVPEDFVPSYRSCVELLARDAAPGGHLSIALTVLLPALIAFAGARTENSPGSQATLLAMYVSVAAATGLTVMHVGHAVPLASSPNCYRSGRLPARSEPETRLQTVELIEFLRRSVAVSVPLLTKAITLVALAIAAVLAQIP
jgi:hypothetical protein